VIGEIGNSTDRLSFDARGRRRNATDWTYNNVPATFLFDRGFTRHEHMDAFGLINANGRIYDPCMGRFLSPDIVVQSPDFTQDYNRYSYAINNPLKYTDPSGFTRPPAFETYWNEYVGLMQQGYERRLVADENVWLFFQWYVKDVNGKWIRRENAMDVTGKGDYVSRDEVYYAEGKEASAFIWSVWGEILNNSISNYVSTLKTIGGVTTQVAFGFKNNVSFTLTVDAGEVYLTLGTPIMVRVQGKGGYATSFSFTLSVGPIGFTIEAGYVGDSKECKGFVSYGRTVGWEISFQANYYKIKSIKGDFQVKDWAGKGYNIDAGIQFISAGFTGNAVSSYPEDIWPSSYYAIKGGYGPAMGFGSYSRTNSVIIKSLNPDKASISPIYPSMYPLIESLFGK